MISCLPPWSVNGRGQLKLRMSTSQNHQVNIAHLYSWFSFIFFPPKDWTNPLSGYLKRVSALCSKNVLWHYDLRIMDERFLPALSFPFDPVLIRANTLGGWNNPNEISKYQQQGARRATACPDTSQYHQVRLQVSWLSATAKTDVWPPITAKHQHTMPGKQSPGSARTLSF